MQYHPRALVGDGGISNSVRRLSAAMVTAGAEVVIAHQSGPTSSPFAPDAGGARWVPVRHIGWPGMQVPTDLHRVLRGADVLILNSAWTAHNVRAGAVAAAHGVPYVVADRGAYDPLILQRRRWTKRVWWQLFERRLVQRARGLHVFFESQDRVVRELGFGGDVIVAPNGVSVPPDEAWDGGSGGYVLYIGRFDPEHKGLDLLVRAVESLPDEERPQLLLRGPDWRGGKAVLEALVAQLDLQHWVQIGPAVYHEEKWGLMTRAAGFAYPSRWEAFGNSAAEAAAMGMPVLVTSYPLGRYLADHGAAILAETTVAGLADGLRRLRSPEAPAIGKGAAQLVSDAFTWDAVAEDWLAQLAALT
ncbi:MAG TPA: glycosyltransferase [Euzebya sp.]|nr:glycosyltransferase [Euzebya sp.]